jgi:glycosyltransferase involved in cell wall biosynthesis
VPPDEIWRYYAEADVYLQSPDIDNAPLSVMEAFASGLPVVSTDAGGVPALLTDGVHGLLVPVGDHEQLADRVLSLFRDPHLATRLASAAHATTDVLGWDRVRDQWMTAYRASFTYPSGNASTVRPT